MLNIAIAGNPNSGKTTLFNLLTGSNQKVGNWPGVTVEHKEGLYIKDKNINFIDLPGIYSLSPYSPEEVVSREFIINQKPDAIINIIDSTNLERNLYLSTQLIETNTPVILALNMHDILKDKIDTKMLSQIFGCPVVEISALKATGIDKLVEVSKNHKSIPNKLNLFEADILKSLTDIKNNVVIADFQHRDWYALKLLENDEKIIKDLNLSELEIQVLDRNRLKLEADYDEDIRGIVINQIYNYITKLRNKILIRSKQKETLTDKIDKIITNKWLAFPILALVMFSLYYFTVSSIGGFITDFINEEFFPIIISEPFQAFLINNNVSPILQSLLIDGIVGGVGAVLGFVPQIMILFFFISILEDVGYMARIAFILDKLFRLFGLSGTSVIPMIIGSGCSVPGIMATRTIKDEANRKLTIMLTPFVICSAKLPIFVLLIGVFFPGNPWMLTGFYFLGIFMVLISGLFLTQFKAFKSDDASFIMELPQYRKPKLISSLKSSLSNGLMFIKNAGTIIFVAAGIVWFLSAFNFRLQFVEIELSMLKHIGTFVSPLFKPLGFGNWQATVATFTGFLAKETVVSTFGVLSGAGEVAESNPTLMAYLPTILDQAGALSMMVFTIFAAPCFAAIAATKRELVSWKWTFIAIGYQTSLAYVLSLIVYNLARLIL